MKILFLTPWYPDGEDKRGVFIEEQVRAISEDHQVVVISSRVDYNKFNFSSFDLINSSDGNVQEHRIVISRSFPVYNQINFFFISARIAIRIAKEFKPDLIHGNIGYPGGFWSWIVSRYLKIPYVITEHTFIYNNFRSSIQKKLTLFSLKRASAVVTVSQIASKEISKYADIKVDVIANIVRGDKFSISPYPTGPISIGFIGGMYSPHHVKGLDKLLSVLAKIDVDFVFNIAGEGKMMTKYKKQAEELGILKQCNFFGFVSYEDVPLFMNQLHFFVNSSRFESFGIAIVEAIASGLPVVSFDNGGPSDFVNSTNGILVENQNFDEFFKAMVWMISNYQSFDREKIRTDVVERFSVHSFMNKMNEVYNNVKADNAYIIP